MLSDNLTLLVQCVAEEDNEACFKKLFMHFYPGLCSFAASIVHNKHQAEEVVEDVLLRLWENRRMLPAIKNITYYLYVATRNGCINCLQRQKPAAGIDIEALTAEEYHFTEQDPEKTMVAGEFAKSLAAFIHGLPPRCSLIFRLVKEEGLKYREVAELLQVSVKTVEAQMALALQKITAYILHNWPEYAHELRRKSNG
jgi:RNA polymerase sigma-70 factor (ECF subfamily)